MNIVVDKDDDLAYNRGEREIFDDEEDYEVEAKLKNTTLRRSAAYTFLNLSKTFPTETLQYFIPLFEKAITH
jgi:hypothetical protein